MDSKAEVTLIVFDNSWHMRSAACLGAYPNQLEAIDLYCHAKLQSNPENAIGIFAMGGLANLKNPMGLHTMSGVRAFSYFEPTSDVDKIMAHLHKDITYCGDLDLIRGAFTPLSLINNLKFKHKRLLFFVGSPSFFPRSTAKEAGKTAKQMGVAVDVVNFFLLEDYNHYSRSLDKFVSAANNNGNSHIKHVPPASSFTALRDALSSSPPIITRASIKQGDIALAAWKKIAREKEDEENHPTCTGKRNRLNLKDNPAPPPKVPRLKSLLVSRGNR